MQGFCWSTRNGICLEPSSQSLARQLNQNQWKAKIGNWKALFWRLVSYCRPRAGTNVNHKTILGAYLVVPESTSKSLYYSSLITELCKLSPSTVGPAVGKSIRKLYSFLADGLDVDAARRLSDWFAVHMSNFNFQWVWREWSVSSFTPAEPAIYNMFVRIGFPICHCRFSIPSVHSFKELWNMRYDCHITTAFSKRCRRLCMFQTHT